MCFSNLPVEFDEAGNPYLADEAADVERPGVDGTGDATAGDVEVDRDPEGAFEAIVESLPDDARERLGERVDGRPTSRPRPDTDSAEGD